MSTSIEMSSRSGSASLSDVPRLCHLRKWPEHDQGSLGFNLITKKSGHFIERIDIGSPAYYCGLKDGDKIHEINGISVVKLAHKIVANMIAESTSAGVAKLLVTDHDTESRLKSLGLDITTGSSDYQVKFIECPETKPDDGLNNPRKDSRGRRKSSVAQDIIKRFSFPEPVNNPVFVYEEDGHDITPTGYKNQPPARLCYLTKLSTEPSFGFIVRTYSDNGDKIALKLDKGGVAERTGIRKGDHIIEINGYNILKENHNQIISRIISSGNVLQLLVVSEKDYRWYRDRGLIPRQTHSIECTTQPKDGQISNAPNVPDSGASNEPALSRLPMEEEPSKTSLEDKPSELNDPPPQWCGTQVPIGSNEPNGEIKNERVDYSSVSKPYDEVIEELQDNFNGGQDVNGASNTDSKSEEELPLNDMTLDNNIITKDESVTTNGSFISERIDRFEITTAHKENNDEETGDNYEKVKDPSEENVIDSELPGLKKSVKEMREDLEKGKRKRRSKIPTAERMI